MSFGRSCVKLWRASIAPSVFPAACCAVERSLNAFASFGLSRTCFSASETDGCPAASRGVADDVAEADPAGADAEADETEPEDEREEEEHPLRMPAKPREEHGVLDYDVGSADCSSRPRALRAASISSSHVFPPFSYRGLPDTRVARTP